MSEIAFLNWFDDTRQVERCGAALVVAVPDEATAAYIAANYECIVHAAAAAEGITQIRLAPHGGAEAAHPPNCSAGSTVEAAKERQTDGYRCIIFRNPPTIAPSAQPGFNREAVTS